jgi:hypothetical protein
MKKVSIYIHDCVMITIDNQIWFSLHIISDLKVNVLYYNKYVIPNRSYDAVIEQKQASGYKVKDGEVLWDKPYTGNVTFLHSLIY